MWQDPSLGDNSPEKAGPFPCGPALQPHLQAPEGSAGTSAPWESRERGGQRPAHGTIPGASADPSAGLQGGQSTALTARINPRTGMHWHKPALPLFWRHSDARNSLPMPSAPCRPYPSPSSLAGVACAWDGGGSLLTQGWAQYLPCAVGRRSGAGQAAVRVGDFAVGGDFAAAFIISAVLWSCLSLASR